MSSGRRKGAIVQLRKVEGLSHLVDVGGCSLHVVSNANKKATEDHFQETIEMVDEIFYLFKYSLKKKNEFKEVGIHINCYLLCKSC